MKTPEFRQAFSGNALAHWSSLTNLSVVELGGKTLLFAASESSAGLQSFTIGADGTTAHAKAASLGGTYSWPDDMLAFTNGGQVRLLLPSDDSGTTRIATPAADGSMKMSGVTDMGAATSMATVTVGGTTFIATADRGAAELRLFKPETNGGFTRTDTKADTDKTLLDGVTDIVSITSGDRSFVLTSSPLEGGITAHEVRADGTLHLTDELRPKDGLWVSGIASLHSVSVGGESYVLAASNLSSSVSVVRVNDLGVMFVQDQMNDDLTTRFHGARDLDSFTLNDRTFIVAGGDDGGLSLLELLPGGTLYHHTSIEAEGWDATSIAAIETVTTGTSVQIFLGSSASVGLTQLTWDMSALGRRIEGGASRDDLTGTRGDDIIIGYDGRDTLTGGAGDDVLMGSAHRDVMWGGAGRDTFVLLGDGSRDIIQDFTQGEDRIDLSGWGMIYDLSSVDIRATNSGAIISWNGHSASVTTSDGSSMPADAWTPEDFLF